MAAWTKDELDKIGAADELQIASVRRDRTLSNAVTIWVVRVGDDLYVRSYKGRDGAWFRATQVRREGRIQAAGVEKDVTFVEETDSGINDQIDAPTRVRAIVGAYGALSTRSPWWASRRRSSMPSFFTPTASASPRFLSRPTSCFEAARIHQREH